MTDQPATTPAADRKHVWKPTTNTLAVWRCEVCGVIGFDPHPPPSGPCVQRWPDDAYDEMTRQRDEARAQVRQLTACQTEADDLRGRVAFLIAEHGGA